MPVPGQYPHNPDRELAMRAAKFSIDDFKVAPCQGCGHERRKPVSWMEQLIHRFNRTQTADLHRTAWFCLGCDRQIDRYGAEVPPESPDRLSDDEKAKL